jgi:hypothetical protein
MLRGKRHTPHQEILSAGSLSRDIPPVICFALRGGRRVKILKI